MKLVLVLWKCIHLRMLTYCIHVLKSFYLAHLVNIVLQFTVYSCCCFSLNNYLHLLYFFMALFADKYFILFA